MNLSDFKINGKFNEDYFENGINSKISLYENYRWMPKRSILMARELVRMYPDQSILDFGCAKGFLVKALRMMGATAFGFDISCYAIRNADPMAKRYLFCPKTASGLPAVDVIFIKDTLEHISYHSIARVLKMLAKMCKKALFIVPFGESGRYRIPDYENDVTHIITEDEAWWSDSFRAAGFKIEKFDYYLPGFKDNWAIYLNGNGFYQLSGAKK